MPVLDSDIVFYGAASMPDDDAPLAIGGAIDLTTRIAFEDIVATDQIEILSSNAGDTTQTVTIHGRNAAGEVISDALSLNGTTLVLSALTFERVSKVVVSAAHAGNITIRDEGTDTEIMLIESGVLQVRTPFYHASAEDGGGAERKYYDKIFARNNHATLSLTSAVIIENADPSAKVAFALESTLNGSDTNGAGNNRQVAPGGYTFDSADKNVVNGQNHTAQAAQGIWLELTLAAGTAAAKSSWTVEEAGVTV